MILLTNCKRHQKKFHSCSLVCNNQKRAHPPKIRKVQNLKVKVGNKLHFFGQYSPFFFSLKMKYTHLQKFINIYNFHFFFETTKINFYFTNKIQKLCYSSRTDPHILNVLNILHVITFCFNNETYLFLQRYFPTAKF